MEGDTRYGTADPGETLAGLARYLPESDPAHGLWLALAAADWQRLALDDGDTSSLLVQLLAHLSACRECLSLVRYVRALAAEGALDTADDAEGGRQLGRLLARLEAAATEDAVRPNLPRYTQVLLIDGEAVAQESFPEVAAHLEVCPTCRLEVDSQYRSLIATVQPDEERDDVAADGEPHQELAARARDERGAHVVFVSYSRHDPLLSLRARRAVNERHVVDVTAIMAAWLRDLGQRSPHSAEERPNGMAHRAVVGSPPRPAMLHLLELDTLERTPVSSLVLRNQFSMAPWWLDVPRSAWQIWVESCTTIDSRMYLDAQPLPCVVHEDDDAREIILLLPEPLRHAAYHVERSATGTGKWTSQRDLPVVPWEKVLGPDAVMPGGGSHSAAARPLPAEPWHRALKAQITQQLSGRRPVLSRSETEDGPSLFFGTPVRDSAPARRHVLLDSENERDGLAHFALGTLYELAAQSGAHEHLQTAIAHYEQAQRYLPPREYPIHDALVRRRLGSAYLQLPTEIGEGHFRMAIDMYAQAATTFERCSFTLDAAFCHVNLGNALAQSARSRRELLDRAIGRYREALRALTVDEHPVAWAATQNNLGMAYRERGEAQHDGKMLELAIGCFDAALRVFTSDRFRVQYGFVKQQGGLAHHRLDTVRALRGGEEHIKSYNEALHALNPEHFPSERAALNWQLGQAHAERPGGGTLAAQDAAHHLREALTIYTKDTHPQQHQQAMDLLAEMERRIQGKD